MVETVRLFHMLLNFDRIIAMLERDGTLKIANLGDCGLRVIRRG